MATEYDVPRCAPGTPPRDCVHEIVSTTLAHGMYTASAWARCAADGDTCTRTDYSIVRFGAGVSFKYAVLDTNSTTGEGEIECSQSVFGIGSPGKRRCDAA
jgi:hypothetical protein